MRLELRAAVAVRHPGPLWRRSGQSCYRVRGRPLTLRNGTRDVAILSEVFSHHAYRPPVRINPRTVLDLGANIGTFAIYARSRWPLDRLVCVEPDPSNLELLHRNTDAEIVAACAGTSNGSVRFRSGRFAESRVAATGDLELPMIDTFALGGFDLVKIDIEGSEWPLLEDPRLSGLAATLVMEYHSLGCPGSDSHETVLRLLDARGFDVVAHQRTGGHGMLWALRRGSMPATGAETVQ